MSDYRVIIRVKNNLLYELMQSAGIKTQSELVRASGASQKDIHDIANLRVGAFNVNGSPSAGCKHLCDFFGCLPEDLFPKEVLHVGIPSNVVERVVASEEVAKYIKQNELDPLRLIEQQDESDYVGRYINRLTEREQEVIRSRYFNDEMLESAGLKLGVTRERIRQIEAKAIRKIKRWMLADAGISE